MGGSTTNQYNSGVFLGGHDWRLFFLQDIQAGKLAVQIVLKVNRCIPGSSQWPFLGGLSDPFRG